MAETTTAPDPLAAPAPDERSPVRSILVIWAVLTVALELFAIFVPARLMGVAASKTMADIKESVTVFTVVAAPVVSVVWAIAIHSLLRWRHRGSGPPPQDGPPLRGNLPVQITWVTVSSVLCLFLFIWGLVAMQTTSAQATGNALVVDVTGQQWLWTFSYPGEGGVTSDVLYLPVNRPVLFDVTSDDVVHSFWVVQMGVKVDANPGEITTVSVTPDRVGSYVVRCAELCGLYHAYMVSQVQVVSNTAFQSWLHANAGSRS
jgi:cytochrome c oxidase subunit 2